MIQKTVLLTSFLAITASGTFAQRRDFKRERARLAQEEREANAGKKGSAYGSNILRLAPVTAMDIGAGFGVSYERLFGRQQMIGIVFPVSLILEDRGNGYFSPGSNGNPSPTEAYLYFTPGLKIYPFGQRRFTYALGPSLMLGYGGGKEWRYANVTGAPVEVRRTRIGIMANNYVSFNITKSFNLGFEAGAGIRYVDREHLSEPDLYNRTAFSKGMGVTGQVSLTLGFRL